MRLSFRLAKLEAANVPDQPAPPWHRIIGDSDAEADAAELVMIADGRAQPGEKKTDAEADAQTFAE